MAVRNDIQEARAGIPIPVRRRNAHDRVSILLISQLVSYRIPVPLLHSSLKWMSEVDRGKRQHSRRRRTLSSVQTRARRGK